MTESSATPGLDELDPRTYERRLVMFGDILGFGSFIERTIKNPLAFELAYRLLDKVSRRRQEWDASETVEASDAIARGWVASVEEHEEMVGKLRSRNRSIAFSDSLVLSAPFDWGGVAFVLAAASTLSLQLLQGGVLLRGAIAEGLLVHEDNLVFGPGLIRAYELESRTAQFPRVILDSVAESHMMEMVADDPGTAAVIGNLLRTDRDRVTHLHILGKPAMAAAGLLSKRQRFLSLVGETLRNRYQAAQREANQAILRKLRWFGDYYNHVINREPELGLKPLDLDGDQ